VPETTMMDERILKLLRRKRQGLSLQDLFKELGVSRRERAKLEARLHDLEKMKLVRRVKNCFLLPFESDIIRGRFETSGRGFGFVIPEGRPVEDIFIPARFAKGALDGDDVEILFKESGRKGKPEGRVVRILKKKKKSIIGLYAERFGSPRIVPFDGPSLEEMPLVSRGSFFPAPGMIISADRASMRITGILGMPDAPGVDTEVVIRKYGLASKFTEESLKEAEEASGLPISPEGRTDYRGWTSFTIDGENARDFDDAVSIRKLADGGYLLGVHIADVSSYVRPGSALDIEAYERGTSVYFPDLTLPMLPEKLSNEMCSLRPREDRLTVSVILEIDTEGNVRAVEFGPSLIRTAERLTYTSVFKVVEGDGEERQRYAHLVPDLLAMRELAGLLRAKRVAEGSLDFDILEPELVYKDGRLDSIATFAQNEAHKLIEEFMVAANVAVASFLGRLGVPSLYRVHPPPSVSDLEKLRETLALFGILLPQAEKIRPHDLQAAIRTAEGRTGEKFVKVRVLRAMRLAIYSEENIGHYGLAKPDYTHFTSPIRRYPDLVVHRILKETLARRGGGDPGLAAIAVHSSEQERKADAAEQDLVEWRIFRFLRARLGEEFDGIVVDITRAGIAVELDDYFVQGLIASGDLGGEFSRPRRKRPLSGWRKERRFELGQKLRVILVSVDPILRRMSFIPAE
jgi:ribonuclease R